MSNIATEYEAVIGATVRTEGDDGIWVVDSYKSGWFTLHMADDERITCKSRFAEIEVIPDDELDEIEQDEDDEEAGSKMGEQLKKYRTKYVPSVAASGKKSLHNGDGVAEALEYKSLDEVYATAGKLLEGWDETKLRAKYEHLNIGSQRMNLGNRLRAAYKRGEEATVTWVEDNLGEKGA